MSVFGYAHGSADAHRLEASDAAGAGGTCSCKSSDMGSENLTCAFWKNRKLSQTLSLLASASSCGLHVDTSPILLTQSDFIELGKRLPDQRCLLHFLLPSVLFLIKDLVVRPLLALNLWPPWFNLPSARITGIHHHNQLITEGRC